MITINNLLKKYNGRTVLEIPKLTIAGGIVWGIVGNNGAGKTTFLRLLLDLIQADRGEISNGGVVVGKAEDWKAFTASYLDEGFLFDFLTPEEFFYLVGNAYGFNRAATDQKLLEFQPFFNDEILGKKKKYIRDFSKGNRQKIGLCSALITEPSVLVLDEPFDGLDPTSQLWLKRKLANYNKLSHATIILSSHDLSHITALASQIALIEKGRIIRDMDNNGTALQELEQYFSLQGDDERDHPI
jgi:ABC-2 type transport system ATP-binding protein